MSYEFVSPFLHGWFWWPFTLRKRRATSMQAQVWTRQQLAYQRAMGARTL